MVNWKRNLAVVWISQFCSLMGFGMSLPFSSYYIQTLGVTEPDAIKFWSGIFVAAACLPLAIMGPIWGMLADRYGRKPMLLRANFSAAVIIGMMALVQNVETLILLRVLQGALTGTVTASMTLVVATAPEHRHGVAMGWLSAAVFSGMTTAAFVGGFLADTVGYRFTFVVSGVMLLIAGLVILLFAQEEFVAPPRARQTLRERWSLRFRLLGPSLPILTILFAMALATQFDTAMFPLLVQELRGGQLEGSASVTGGLNAMGAIGAMLSGLVFGRLADRWAPGLIGRFTAFGAGFFLLLIGLSSSFNVLFPARLGMYFFAGGMDPVFQSWLSRTTPESRRGTVLGLSVTSRSVGWLLAPLLSQWVARTWSIGMVFLVGPFLFWLLIPLIGIMGRRVKAQAPEPAVVPVPESPSA